MEYLLVIPGTLNNLNDYIDAERSNRYQGAKMKADNEKYVVVAIRQCLKGVRIEKPVEMNYTWYEPNKRRDKDNVSSFGRKVIQDALVNAAVSVRRDARPAVFPEIKTRHSLLIRKNALSAASVWKNVRSRQYSRTRKGGPKNHEQSSYFHRWHQSVCTGIA